MSGAYTQTTSARVGARALGETKGWSMNATAIPNFTATAVQRAGYPQSPEVAAASREQFVKVPVWLIRDPNLSDAAKVLYPELRSYAWDTNGRPCTASQKRLATELGWSVDKVKRTLRELENAGHVTKTRQPGRPNAYAVTYRTGAV